MIALQSSSRLHYAFFVQFVMLLWLLHQNLHPRRQPTTYLPPATPSAPFSPPPPADDLDPTQNSTLGFGSILYISMPSRTDRRDALHLAASYTNLTLTMIAGVDGSTIHSKAKPANTRVTVPELGSWRAHADAWRHIVDSGAETALVLEDDVDWDVDIRKAARALAEHMQRNPLRVDGRERGGGVYGDDWDVLWVSSCIHDPNPKFEGVHSEFADDTAPGRVDVTNDVVRYWKSHGGGEYPELGGKRLLAPAFKPICIWGYAVSRRGAQKLLTKLGLKGLAAPADLAMMMAHEKGELWGYVVQPGWFWPWRLGGAQDSDIQKYGGTPKGHHKGKSDNIRNSARKAMQADWDTNDAWTKAAEVYTAKMKQQ